MSLANLFFLFARGWEQVATALGVPPRTTENGKITGFEHVATHVTPDLACTVEVERSEASGRKRGRNPIGSAGYERLRREDGVWRIAHRHADPIVSVQPAEPVIPK